MDWEQRWKDKQTPWDLGQPHQGAWITLNWFSTRNQVTANSRVCLPLCGSAQDAAPFLERQFKVIGFDLSSQAIEIANGLHSNSSQFEGVVADFFDLASEQHKFDLIFDRAGLCALPPNLHVRYLNKVHDLLVEGGFFAVIVFDEIHPKIVSPPFAIPGLDFLEMAFEFFDLEEAQKLEVPAQTPGLLKETLYLLRKK